jgi:hypothetical protein
LSETDRQASDEANDRTFNDEQRPLFESDDTSDKTRPRTPGAQTVPPAGPAETGDGTPEVSDAG